MSFPGLAPRQRDPSSPRLRSSLSPGLTRAPAQPVPRPLLTLICPRSDLSCLLRKSFIQHAKLGSSIHNHCFFKGCYLFLGKWGEKHRSVASPTHPKGDETCNPGTCLDQEPNLRPFTLLHAARPPEPRGQVPFPVSAEGHRSDPSPRSKGKCRPLQTGHVQGSTAPRSSPRPCEDPGRTGRGR